MEGIATQNPPEGLGGGERAPALTTKISTLSTTFKTQITMSSFKKLSECSLQQYINKQNAVLDIVENKQSGKTFFNCGGTIGAIGKKALEAMEAGTPATELRMAEIAVFEDDNQTVPAKDRDGKDLVLLCIQARGTVNVIRSFKPTV